MIFVSHANSTDHMSERAQANSLRHYVREKSRGRRAPKYVYHATHTKGLIGYVGCAREEPPEKKIIPQRYRRPGPWCEVLGHDTSIADDQILMAYLAMQSEDDPKDEAHEWNRMLHEVTRDRIKALRAYRNKGLEILQRQARRQSSASLPAADAKALVSSKYAKRGDGIRPLKLPKSQN